MTPGKAVCIVDDDESVRDSLQFLLTCNGLLAHSFSTPSDLMGRMPGDIGCLILDLHMPDMNGLELMTVLRGAGISAPIIIISGRRDAAADAALRGAGAMAILSKPFDDRDLLLLLKQAMEPSAG